ncbi:MAG: tripartite tricarboxylate transporter substrate binding protein [Betaproteobacteria bacterium]
MKTIPLACLLAALLPLAPAAAQQYPNKPIRVIAPSSAGGPVDVIARILAPAWSEALGQPMVIDNRAGAAGQIGTEMAAKALPDGYTVLLGFSGPLVIVPQINVSTPYDTLKDFAPVSLVAAAPYVLLVHPNVAAKTVKELVALAKAQPGKLNFASGGTGVGIHMAGELFNLTTGVKITHVPYKGAGPGMTALLAGEVDMMFNGLSAALPQVKGGRLRAIALGGEKRSALMPELPTIAESGYQFNTSGWYGPMVAKDTPRAIIMKLNSTLLQALKQPQVRDRLNDIAVEAIGSTPEEYTALLRRELATWGRVVEATGLKGKQIN